MRTNYVLKEGTAQLATLLDMCMTRLRLLKRPPRHGLRQLARQLALPHSACPHGSVRWAYTDRAWCVSARSAGALFQGLIRLQARPDCSGVATAPARVARPPPPHPGALCKGYKVHRTNHVGVRARAILKRDRVRRIATDHDAAQAIIISILLQQHERRVGQLISIPSRRAWAWASQTRQYSLYRSADHVQLVYGEELERSALHRDASTEVPSSVGRIPV